MRRSLLFTGIAMGAIAILTAFTLPAKTDKLKEHMSRVREVAYFQKSYEIACSFPSYESRKVKNKAKIKILISRADYLESKSKKLDALLHGDLKIKAMELGMDDSTYDTQLVGIKEDAELEAVETFKKAEDPAQVLSHLDEASKNIFS